MVVFLGVPGYICPPTMVGGYTPFLVHIPPYTPWVYPVHPWSAAPLSACPDCCTVGRRGGPGLKKVITPGWERLERPRVLKV